MPTVPTVPTAAPEECLERQWGWSKPCCGSIIGGTFGDRQNVVGLSFWGHCFLSIQCGGAILSPAHVRHCQSMVCVVIHPMLRIPTSTARPCRAGKLCKKVGAIANPYDRMQYNKKSEPYCKNINKINFSPF